MSNKNKEKVTFRVAFHGLKSSAIIDLDRAMTSRGMPCEYLQPRVSPVVYRVQWYLLQSILICILPWHVVGHALKVHTL